jgi:hypothetical protein
MQAEAVDLDEINQKRTRGMRTMDLKQKQFMVLPPPPEEEQRPVAESEMDVLCNVKYP